MTSARGEDPDDPDTLAAWAAEGFGAAETRAWLDAAPGRFTPWTARLWIAQGFGPGDAAIWSEVYADPVAARQRRAAGYADPFDPDE